MNSTELITPQSANRERLMKSAFTLFQRFGIKKVTVEEIARGANVSKMTFYKYFRNKKDILLTIMDRELKQGQKSTAENGEGQSTTFVLIIYGTFYR